MTEMHWRVYSLSPSTVAIHVDSNAEETRLNKAVATQKQSIELPDS